MAKFRQQMRRLVGVVLTSVALVAAGPLGGTASATPSAPAQTPVEVSPESTGMPGVDFMQQALGWLSQLALWGSLASILIGAAVYGIAQNSANYNGAFRGKQLAAAGAIGACLAGLAPTAVNMLFGAAS